MIFQVSPGPPDTDDIRRHLQEFIDTAPELGAITNITLVAGKPELLAATGSASAERREPLDVGRLAIEQNALVWGKAPGPFRVLAVPMVREGRTVGAVAVTVSFDTLYRLRDHGRVIALWATLFSVVALVVVVELLVRWFIHRPIDALRDTMKRVSAGEASARGAGVRRDELGAVASGPQPHAGANRGPAWRLPAAHRPGHTRSAARNRDCSTSTSRCSNSARSWPRPATGRRRRDYLGRRAPDRHAAQPGSGHIQLASRRRSPSRRSAAACSVAEEQTPEGDGDRPGAAGSIARRPREPSPSTCRVIRRLCALVQPALESAGVGLGSRCADVPAVSADGSQLELALLNLVSNAIDAMPQAGELGIRLSAGASHAMIDVTDTGSRHGARPAATGISSRG